MRSDSHEVRFIFNSIAGNNSIYSIIQLIFKCELKWRHLIGGKSWLVFQELNCSFFNFQSNIKVSEYDQDIYKRTLQTNPWHLEEEPQKIYSSVDSFLKPQLLELIFELLKCRFFLPFNIEAKS